MENALFQQPEFKHSATLTFPKGKRGNNEEYGAVASNQKFKVT